jgi:hypothetical protein
VPPYTTRLLVLPSGQILMTMCNRNVYIYTPDPGYNPAWAPSITNSPGAVSPGGTYPLSGTQLNGISQGSSYGDDYWAPTNYPIVRIQNNWTGHVFYCRTFGHSTMGICTGSAIVSTNFKVPASIEIGPSTITCIANGIPSTPAYTMVLPPPLPSPSLGG